MTKKLYTYEEYFEITHADVRTFLVKNRLAAYEDAESVPARSLDEWDQLADEHAAERRGLAGIR